MEKESNCGNLDILDFPGARTPDAFSFEKVNSFDGDLDKITDMLIDPIKYPTTKLKQTHKVIILSPTFVILTFTPRFCQMKNVENRITHNFHYLHIIYILHKQTTKKPPLRFAGVVIFQVIN